MLFFKNNFILIFILFSSIITSCGVSKEEMKSSETKIKSTKKNVIAMYAKLLGVDEKDIENPSLYAFIDEWYGTPYKYGGKTKQGIDCSGFVTQLYEAVYKQHVKGTAASMMNESKIISKDKLREGDLLFFKIESNNVGHVGIYLQNNKFVHASTKKGIVINDLDDSYYKKYFYKGGNLHKQ